MVRSTAAVCILLLCGGPVSAADAPKALFGKSIIIKWQETRVQRHVGEPSFYDVRASHNLSIYVSGEGRVFNRLTNTTRAGTAGTDQVAGSDGAKRVPAFKGQAMDVYAPFQAGGMRHVAVEFDTGFASCKAKVTYAKPPGTKESVAFSPITKKYVEFQSLTPGSASCELQSGNVFGGT